MCSLLLAGLTPSLYNHSSIFNLWFVTHAFILQEHILKAGGMPVLIAAMQSSTGIEEKACAMRVLLHFAKTSSCQVKCLF